ncbi:hypothetical protein E2C01_008396 [Portunus trituberculatus]|uniref:Uncharacterized protein n=1 Tax=Portunus trituberculatus TaxID=210409 RepID=A0A5B7D0P9_PORTR|nr:hypothetical protein [Portunus trituberculatus]
MAGDRRCSGVNVALVCVPRLPRGSPRAPGGGRERGGTNDTEGKKGAKKIYKTINKRKETERATSHNPPLTPEVGDSNTTPREMGRFVWIVSGALEVAAAVNLLTVTAARGRSCASDKHQAKI